MKNFLITFKNGHTIIVKGNNINEIENRYKEFINIKTIKEINKD